MLIISIESMNIAIIYINPKSFDYSYLISKCFYHMASVCSCTTEFVSASLSLFCSSFLEFFLLWFP